MSNTINYVVTYNSDINTLPSPTYLSPIKNITLQRNIAPSEDNATITLGGIQKIDSAREVYFYRVNSDGTYTLKFRGMTTNPTYHVADDGLVTSVQINSLWYMLQTRLFQIAGKSPPPLQPNTNPYLVYLNPTLGLDFGMIWADILVNAFQESYSTGHLPPLHLANINDDGSGNMNIGVEPPYLTDFDPTVVNDNMNIQYQSISAVVDRLVTSALFNAGQGSPFLAEYRMNIGDYPTPLPSIPHPEFVTPKLPTATVMLFDPVHGKLGNGNNRTGVTIGDFATQIDPAGTLPASLAFPMAYVEFGVTNGYLPIDTIIFSEGDNIVSIDLTYDYLVMNNSYVLSGGSFQGSDVVALPIDNQRSIAEYGLKQTNQPLSNVVDQGEIKRFVGTSINFFQHPIPNIVIKPDYVYASTHILYAGDYIMVNAPSLAGVLEDSNGNPLIAYQAATAAFTARIKTIDITWNPTDGEDITLTLTFPVQNVPIAEWNAAHNTQQLGSPGGAIQSMYTVVEPAAKTMLGRGRQAEGAATHQSGGDFLTNRNNPTTVVVTDTGTTDNVTPDVGFLELPIFAQHIPNNMDAINWDGSSVKGDDILIYQFGVEVDTPDTAPSNTASAPSNVYLTVIQPDGMAIIDTIVDINQLTNILSLISKSHERPPLPPPGTPPLSAPLLTDEARSVNLSGRYQIIVRNSKAFVWCPNPLFQTPSLLSPPSAIPNTAGFVGYSYIITPCIDAAGDYPFGMSYWTWITSATIGVGGHNVALTWNIVSGAGSYNIYRQDSILTPDDILRYGKVGTSVVNSFTDSIAIPTAGLQPYPPFVTQTLTPAAVGGSIVVNQTYWYVVTAVNSAGNETVCSAAGAYDHTGTIDTEPPVNPVALYIEWPTVPQAVSYNIYRGDGPAAYTLATLWQLQTSIFDTNFTDDGSITPSSTTHPPSEMETETRVGSNAYTIYANHSFLQDPANTQTASGGGTNNPSTAIVYDPTQRRVYQTYGYVAPF